MEGSHARHAFIFAMLHDNRMTHVFRMERRRLPKLIHNVVVTPLARHVMRTHLDMQIKYMILLTYLFFTVD